MSGFAISRRLALVVSCAMFALWAIPATALGSPTSTEIEAPARVHPGEWFTIRAGTNPIPASWPPEGTVTFYDGGTPLPHCDEMQIQGEGGGTYCETPLNTIGKHQIWATYTGTPDEEFEASTSRTITIEVGESTETEIVVESKVKVGQTVYFEAFTSPRTGLSESTDTFYDGGAPIAGCTEVEVFGEGGMGPCEATFNTPGIHHISVSFSGTANGEYFPSTGHADIEVEPAAEEPKGEETPEEKGSEEPAGEKGSGEPKGKEGPKEPTGEGKAAEEAQSRSGGAKQPGFPAPVRLTDPLIAPVLVATTQRPRPPVLLSRPPLLIINARRLSLAVRCGSPRCALSAGISVHAGGRSWRLPATVQPASLTGYAHLVFVIPARVRGDLRSFLLAHSHAHPSIQVLLDEQSMTSTATLRLRTKPGFR